jgi:hypothetical protein
VRSLNVHARVVSRGRGEFAAERVSSGGVKEERGVVALEREVDRVGPGRGGDVGGSEEELIFVACQIR